MRQIIKRKFLLSRTTLSFLAGLAFTMLQPGPSNFSSLHAEILIGVTGSYQALTASQEYGGPTKSLNQFDDAVTVHAGTASLFLQSVPDPIFPHVYLSPYIDISTLETNTSDAYLKATTGELGYGLYLATGNLYRGDVGFFVGLIAAGRVSDLEGQFDFGRNSLYETYVNVSGSSDLDHIDVLNYSRQQSGSFTNTRKQRYLLFKAGVLSRTDYMLADIVFSKRIDTRTLVALALTGQSFNDIHKFYSLYSESTEKNDVFYGAAPNIELGYMRNHFLIKYKGGFPIRYRSGKGSMSIETHSLTMGVYFTI